MVKKKQDSKRKVINLLIFLMGLCVIVVLILGFTLGWDNLLGKLNVTIYKEECRNESHKDWIDTNISTCNKYLFNGESVQCYNESESEFKCDRERCLFTLIEKTENGWNYYEDIEIIDMSNKNISWNKLVRVYEEICEPIPVDEIIIFYKENRTMHETYEVEQEMLNKGESSFKEFCINKKQGKFYNKTDEMMCFYFKEKIKQIFKKDITIDWLEENCECVEKSYECEKEEEEFCRLHEEKYGLEYSIEEFGESCREIWCDTTCQKYKCGEYIVEVK